MPSRAASLAAQEWIVVVLLSAALCVCVAVARGQQRNADLLNYHFYNGYALLEGRLGQDLDPAGPATYFNPALDVVHYLGYRYVRPVVLVALLATLHSLNLILIWAIARCALGTRERWLAPLAALVAAGGQNAVSLLGTPFSDNTVSIPALGALLALLRPGSPGPRWLLAAGALGGAAVGLKLTMAAPHAGLAALAVLMAWRQRRPLLVAAFALGSLAGWGAADGWWAFQLWLHFDNPLLPFLNGVFRSPFGLSTWIADPRWTALGAMDWIRPPVDAAFGISHRLQEVRVQDPRLLLGFLALVPWALARAWTRGPAPSPGPRFPRAAADLAFYWLVTYGAWVAVFHYYRYATILELLAPALAVALLAEVWPRRIKVVAPLMAVLLLLTTSVSFWGPGRPWRPFWFDPRLPASVDDPGQLVLLATPATSFAAAFFPPETVFIGLSYRYWHGPAMEEAISTRLAGHDGPLRALIRGSADPEVLEGLGVRIVADACQLLRFGPVAGPLLLCRLERRNPTRASQGAPSPVR